MKTKIFLFAAALSLVGGVRVASASPAISVTSENAVQIRSAKIVAAPGGGSYVMGTAKAISGYAAPRATHVHVSIYDATGKLLSEKVDKISRGDLTRRHLRPEATATYVVFFPWESSQIAKATVVEHSGHGHPAS